MAPELDPNRTQAFAERMMQTLNDAFVAMMLSIGHQTGLLEAMADLPPSTADEIAKTAGLDARNVREWLDTMVVGRVVDYDPKAGRYHLPAEHAASLTTRPGAPSMAPQMRWVSCMGEVEPRLVEAFREGRGVPYSAYSRFHGIMNQANGQVFDQTLVDVTLPVVPGLVEHLRKGIDVLDVGCGSGHAVNLMARAFPASRFCGYDFSPEGIAAAEAEAKEWGLENARFRVQDAAKIDDETAFDFIASFDAIHDQAQPRLVLANIARALRPDGLYLMVEPRAATPVEENLDAPMAPFLYAISAMHCMQVSLFGEGEGVGAAWGEQMARDFLKEASFGDPESYNVDGDVMNSYYVARLEG
jgi:SAM-dependent methyltransferase